MLFPPPKRVAGRALAVLAALAVTAGLPRAASAQDLASFEKRTTVHVLKNGWTFIIVERPVAPVFSFATHADVGAVQDPKGQTGMAHMFEHMAFKGTPVIGTTDFEKEKVALEEEEKAYQAYVAARDKQKPDKAEVEKLHAAFKEKEAAATSVRQEERVRRDGRARRRRRLERRHQLRFDGLFLFAAVEQVRAVRLSRIRALLAAGVPRVLQGTRRRDRRAPHAHREPADRTPGRALRRSGVLRASLRHARRSAIAAISNATR